MATDTVQTERRSPFSIHQRFSRLVWSIVQVTLFRVWPRGMFGFRRSLLRLFGAKLHSTARVYGTTTVWAPWNLEMGPGSVLADGVNCYNVAPVILDQGATVSQDAYLCTAGHDIHDPGFPLVTAPIHLHANSWVGAKAVIGMGVTIGPHAVVALAAVVVKSVEPKFVVGGNPARTISRRRCCSPC